MKKLGALRVSSSRLFFSREETCSAESRSIAARMLVKAREMMWMCRIGPRDMHHANADRSERGGVSERPQRNRSCDTRRIERMGPPMQGERSDGASARSAAVPCVLSTLAELAPATLVATVTYCSSNGWEDEKMDSQHELGCLWPACQLASVRMLSSFTMNRMNAHTGSWQF